MEKIPNCYNDVYRTEFEAEVLEIRVQEHYSMIRLDKTWFYPGGGGQPCDSGEINGLKINEVLYLDGDIWHKTDQKCDLKINSRVDCRIDFELRYFYMQSHSAQHLLSALFYNLFKINTISVHFGEEYFTIEFKISELSEDRIYNVVNQANKAIRGHVPVRGYFPGDDLYNMNLRRSPKQTEDIRVVEIENIDRTPCGGTHVSNLSEIQMIVYIGSETIRGNIRIKFMCGSQLWKEFERNLYVVNEQKRIFSCSTDEIPEKSEMYLERLKEITRHRDILFNRYIDTYLCFKTANNPGNKKIPIVLYQTESTDEIKLLSKIPSFSIPAILIGINADNNIFVIKSDKTENMPLDAIQQLIQTKLITGGGANNTFQGKIIKNVTLNELISYFDENSGG